MLFKTKFRNNSGITIIKKSAKQKSQKHTSF
nr:MAG TPA: hypothetical protein [Caudoviricetes sp.]